MAFYPKKDYWGNLLGGVQSKPGFSRSLELDVNRLKLAVGQIKSADQFMEMAQLSLQAGVPAEAQKIIEQGYKAGLLGTGAAATVDRQKRLRDFAAKSVTDDSQKIPATEAEAIKAKDANAMANVGYAYVTMGQFDKGIGLIQQAIDAGNLKHPDEVKLHLGMAYHQAAKKSDAIKTLKTVQGTDGAADLARYWIMQINHPLSY